MKYLLFTCSLFVFSNTDGQDLREFVPNDAIFVGSINGSNILETVSISELDNSKIGREVLEDLTEKIGIEVASFNDFGINANANTYFYYGKNDSLSYITLVTPLKDSRFLDRYLKVNDSDVIDTGKYKYLRLSKSNYLAWDNQKLLAIYGDYNEPYFTGYDFSAIEAEIALNGEGVEEYDADDIIIDVVEDVAYEEETYTEMAPQPAEAEEQALYPLEPAEEITRDFIPYLYNNQLQLYADDFYVFCESIKEAAENNDQSIIEDLELQVEKLHDLASQVDSISDPDPVALDNYMENKIHYVKIAIDKFQDGSTRDKVKELVDGVTYKSGDFRIYVNNYDYGYGDYKDYYTEKNVLEDKWTENMLHVAMVPSTYSILNNKKYLGQYDSKAAISVWNSNLGRTVSDWYSGIYSYIIGYNNQEYDFVEGYGGFSSNLYLEGLQTRIGVDVTLNEEFAKAFQRMGDQKINKRFFKYINEDNLIGYMTYKINSKNFLEEYPGVFARTYSPLLGAAYADEMELGTAFFSLVLDEEAVSKLIKGDVYFGLTGIEEKEVTYFDYEYDEDYNYNEIEKTKMETLPAFMVMATTKDEAFTTRLINYLSKKSLIVPESGYYKIIDVNNDIPLDLYFVIKNDIFFLSTSSTEISAIVADTFQGKLSGKHKKMMKGGNFSAFFNGSKFGEQFPFEEDIPDINGTRFAIENASDFYLKSSRVKNRKMHTELIMEIPANHKNLINYMMSFIEHMD